MAPYSYNAEGRRDPFQSLVGTGGDAKAAPQRSGEGLAGMTVNELSLRGMDRIELGLGALEEGIEICTTHPAEARAVLTGRVMRRLGQLSERLGKERPALALYGSDVLLAVESNTNRFQGGSVFKPIDLVEQLDRITADIALLFELAEDLRDALASRAAGSRRA